MDRCWLKGATGDTLHALLCAIGYNLRWSLRAIARLNLSPDFLRRLFSTYCRQMETNYRLDRLSAPGFRTHCAGI
jgi:IS5 family transposase